MPVRNPVPELQTLCISVVARVIGGVLEDGKELLEYGPVIHELQTCLSVLPVSVQEILLHQILDMEVLGPLIRYWALNLLLSPQMKMLSVGIFPHTYFVRVGRVIGKQGTGLQSLNLRGMWLKGMLSTNLENLLCSLKYLQKLYIPHMATDTVLKTIGECNGYLQVLDITGECAITRAGVELLCNKMGTITQNLQYVYLGNPGGIEVSPDAVAVLIKNLPNLQSLGSYPYVGQAIEYLIDGFGETEVQTNLIHIRDSYTDLKQMNLLIKRAAQLESIYLDHPSDDVIPQMHQFSHIKKIKLQRFQLNDLYILIQKAGHKISSIELVFGSGILDLSLLSRTCLNLSKLTCYKMDSIRHLNSVEFTNIKNIGIYYSDISTSCFKSLMTAAPNIVKLSLGDFLEITDEDIIEIFTTRQFNNLTHIWFPNAVYLTSVSVQILIESCPNLAALGELSGWNLTQAEIILFKETIEANNLNLKLIDYL